MTKTRPIGLVNAEVQDCLREIAEVYRDTAELFNEMASLHEKYIGYQDDSGSTQWIDSMNDEMATNLDEFQVMQMKTHEQVVKMDRLLKEVGIISRRKA